MIEKQFRVIKEELQDVERREDGRHICVRQMIQLGLIELEEMNS